jgi:glucokinase
VACTGGVILCGDIGGTKTHLASFAPERPTEPIGLVTYASKSALDLGELVARHALPGPVDAACFAIAGPVIGDRVETTNLPWVVEGARLSAQLGGAPVFLLNDLQALGHGVGLMTASQLEDLNPGRTALAGNVAVIAAGSGLGEAGLVSDGRLFHAFASEGGHTEFGPRSEREIALLRYLAGRFGHVSYERIVSGPGLVNVFAFLRDVERMPVPDALAGALAAEDPAAAIAAAALAGAAPIAVAALDLFARIYGAEAGNLALKLMAVGGVFVGGGIAPKILPKLRDGVFLEAFVDKGRFRPLLERIPVRVVLEPRAGLYGAAGYAAARLAA